ANVRLAGVQPHANTQLDALGPVVLCECALGLDCGGRGARSVLEHHEELVAPMIDHLAPNGRDRLAKEAPVVVQELGVAVAELLDKLRRAFDVCEEEGDGSMGKLRHRSLLQRDLSTNAGSGARW